MANNDNNKSLTQLLEYVIERLLSVQDRLDKMEKAVDAMQKEKEKGKGKGGKGK